MKRLLLPLLAALALPTAVEADTLRDNYFKQEKRKQEESRKCLWYLRNSQRHSKNVDGDNYFFDWENNTVLVFKQRTGTKPPRCTYHGTYKMGQIYREGGGYEIQYLVEYSGKRGTLVKYTQWPMSSIYRTEVCDCITRN